MRNLKQALNHGLSFKKVHKVIKFDQNVWLKPYIDMNTNLRKKKTKNDFEKDFFKLMNNAVFVKTIKKCEKTQSYLTCHKIKKKELFSIRVSEPNYCTKKFLTEHVLAMEMKKNKTKQNKKKKQKRTNTCQ